MECLKSLINHFQFYDFLPKETELADNTMKRSAICLHRLKVEETELTPVTSSLRKNHCLLFANTLLKRQPRESRTSRYSIFRSEWIWRLRKIDAFANCHFMWQDLRCTSGTWSNRVGQLHRCEVELTVDHPSLVVPVVQGKLLEVLSDDVCHFLDSSSRAPADNVLEIHVIRIPLRFPSLPIAREGVKS